MEQYAYCSESLGVYGDLTGLSIGFNEFSFAGVLTVCVKLKDLGLSGQVHCHVLTAGYLEKCGSFCG